MVNIDVSDSLPKACNEKSSHSHELDHNHNENNSNNNNHYNNNNSRLHSTQNLRRRMHKVRHDDHVDYLVHDPTTNELHLEHPACNDCGQDDVHGKFRSVGKRQLQRGETGGSGGKSAVKGGGGAAGGNKQHRSIRIHFFEVAPHIGTILDAFDLTSGRVAAVEHILDSTPAHSHPDQRNMKSKIKSDDFWGIPPKVVTDAHGSGGSTSTAATAVIPQKKQTAKVSPSFLPPDLLDTSQHGHKKAVRSTLACSRICCAAETPIIRGIMDKLAGVEKVMINVPLKQVIVDHFPEQISAKDIAATLNKNHFGASIKRDGGASAMTSPPTAADMAALPTKGRSHFFVQHICCASEIPAINCIVEPIKGVSAVSINVTTKTVYVDHDTKFVSALDICEALNQEGFGAQVRHDFSTAAASARSMFVKSTLTFEHEPSTADPDTQALIVFLRTFDASQLESFVVDVPAKTITVVHNPLGLSAQTIADQLFEPVGINATVLSDGADTKMWDIPTLDEDSSIDGMEGDEPMTYPSPAVTLSGIFWIISMLSFTGGNW
jgi:copper chaperone CopZ